MMKKTPPAASLAYVERVFRYLASLLYFLERLDKLLAFESNAEEKHEDVKRRNLKYTVQYTILQVLLRDL